MNHHIYTNEGGLTIISATYISEVPLEQTNKCVSQTHNN